MKTRRFDFNWKPIQLQISFAVASSVPEKQNYSADTGEFTPDYTLTPLIIQPEISLLDKDEILPAGHINAQLVNVKWYENIGGVSTLIASDNPNYEITTSGNQAGRIKVKKNAQPLIPITLEFYAEYVDSRTQQLFVIRGTKQVECSSASDQVRIELDAADQTIYNPFTDPATQVVRATIYLADKKVTDGTRYTLVWEVLGYDNNWHTVGADEVLDYYISVSGDTATINRSLMGAEAYLRCRCKYSASGTPASVPLTADTPTAQVCFKRLLPKYEYDQTGVPYNIPPGTLRVAPEAIVWGTKGNIANFETELLPLWYIATNKASGSLSYTLVGHGKNPTIPTAAMNSTYGAVIGLDVKDRGAACAWEDGDGKIFCNGSGEVIIVK